LRNQNEGANGDIGRSATKRDETAVTKHLPTPSIRAATAPASYYYAVEATGS